MLFEDDKDDQMIEQLAQLIAAHLETSEEESIIPNPEEPEDDRFNKIRSAVLRTPDAGNIGERGY
jgi:hypothetical protein